MKGRGLGAGAALVVVGLLCGCATTLEGGWSASGHLGEADAFDLDLTFADLRGGLAVYTTADKTERQVPVCGVRFDKRVVSFLIDTAGETTCATMSHPLRFTGTLGAHIIAGEIFDAAAKRVGIWRAYRRPR